ncbi:hypothetical protein [Cysteiniphilum litorale]|uniref:hypothetical protein n=1 Tax=Cysteiniphilum litorale TaxID=2056700 RepID=UPI003F880BDC
MNSYISACFIKIGKDKYTYQHGKKCYTVTSIEKENIENISTAPLRYMLISIPLLVPLSLFYSLSLALICFFGITLFALLRYRKVLKNFLGDKPYEIKRKLSYYDWFVNSAKKSSWKECFKLLLCCLLTILFSLVGFFYPKNGYESISKVLGFILISIGSVGLCTVLLRLCIKIKLIIKK